METASCAIAGMGNLRGAEVDGDVDAGKLLSIFGAVHDGLLRSRICKSLNQNLRKPCGNIKKLRRL